MPQTNESITWMQSWGKKTSLLWFRLIILIMMKTNYGRCVFSRCSNTILRREIVKLFVVTLCYLIFKIFSGTKQLLLTVLPTECLNWNIVMWKRNKLQSLTTITNQPNHSSYQNSNLNTNPTLFPIPHSLPFFSLTHTHSHRSPTRSNSVHEGRVHWTQNSLAMMHWKLLGRLPPADFRIGKLGPLGRFTVHSFSNAQSSDNLN